MCYRKEDHPTSCPITDIKIIDVKNKDTLLPSYQLHNLTPTLILAFSRDFDSLPLTTTTLAYKPCMLSHKPSLDPAVSHYPTELDRLNGCEAFQTTGEFYDKYYRETGLEVSLWEV